MKVEDKERATRQLDKSNIQYDHISKIDEGGFWFSNGRVFLYLKWEGE